LLQPQFEGLILLAAVSAGAFRPSREDQPILIAALFIGVILFAPEAGRQVIYGGVIIPMLLVYGRGERATT